MRTLCCFGRDESGQTLLLAAVMLPVLIGSVGMAVDIGYAFDYRQQMQMSADSGALAGAYAVDANVLVSSSDLAAVVDLDTAQNGFANGAGGVTITVCRPGVDIISCPTIYTYLPTDKAVKVTISQPKATFFSRVLGLTSLTVGVSAVASSSSGGGGSDSNIVILDPTCKDGAFTASGSSDVAVNGSIYVNSCGSKGLTVSGGGAMVANGGITLGCNAMGTCGNYVASGGSTVAPMPATGPQIEDPLKDLPEPTPTGTNYADPNISSGTQTLDPGIYPGLTISGGTVTFNPGIYFIDGMGGGKKLNLKNTATVLGDGVMFYLYNTAQLNIANTATTVTMSAPTSGTYRGIWLFQERANTKNPTVSGTATVNVDGTIYVSAPGTKLTFSGGSSSGTLASYTVFVVWNFTLSGGGTWNSDFSSIGGSPLGGAKGVALAE